jgi:hypothetical protein
MSRDHPNFTPARRPGHRPTTREASSFLQGDDVMAGLLPTLEKMAALQADAGRLLPGVFTTCRVLQLREGQLHIAVPNAALATRIRQMLPKLQVGLREKGWPIDAIRIKVQMMSGEDRVPDRPAAQAVLPTQAVQAFAELAQSLDASPLRDALQSLVKRRS